MQNNHGYSCPLATFADRFPEQLASVEHLGLSKNDAFQPDSLRYSTHFFKQLRTLRLDTDILPKDIVWGQLTDLSVRVEQVDGFDSFINRHPRLKRLSILLDFALPKIDPSTGESFQAQTKVILAEFLEDEAAQRILRSASFSLLLTLQSYLLAVQRGVKRALGRDDDVINERLDKHFTLLRNELASEEADRLTERLQTSSGGAVQVDVTATTKQSLFDNRSSFAPGLHWHK